VLGKDTLKEIQSHWHQSLVLEVEGNGVDRLVAAFQRPVCFNEFSEVPFPHHSLQRDFRLHPRLVSTLSFKRS
jgi:hypothetical protein